MAKKKKERDTASQIGWTSAVCMSPRAVTAVVICAVAVCFLLRYNSHDPMPTAAPVVRDESGNQPPVVTESKLTEYNQKVHEALDGQAGRENDSHEEKASVGHADAVTRLRRAMAVLYAPEAVELVSEQHRLETIQACTEVNEVFNEIHAANLLKREEFKGTPTVLQQCREQMNAFERQDEAEANTKVRQVRQIPREHNLSWNNYVQRYAATKTPVILTGKAVDNMLREKWTLDKIVTDCGDKEVMLSKLDKNHSHSGNGDGEELVDAWADLHQVQKSTVLHFITAMRNRELATPLYLFDWSIPAHCPALLKSGFNIPPYFSSDLFQRLPHDLGMRDGWPSLLVGPNGTGAGLHVDTYATHFWMLINMGVNYGGCTHNLMFHYCTQTISDLRTRRMPLDHVQISANLSNRQQHHGRRYWSQGN